MGRRPACRYGTRRDRRGDREAANRCGEADYATFHQLNHCSFSRFRSIARSYFRKAHGVLLLYDVTSESSFLSVRAWVDQVQVTGHTCAPPPPRPARLDLFQLSLFLYRTPQRTKSRCVLLETRWTSESSVQRAAASAPCRGRSWPRCVELLTPRV